MNARTPTSDPGEPKATDAEAPHHRDHDDLIGFASSAALEGRRRETERAPSPQPEIAPSGPDRVVRPVFEPAATQPFPTAQFTPRFGAEAQPEPTPAWASGTHLSDQAPEGLGRRREQPASIDGAMGLYAVYALILFAVPTLGVSAAIALFAVMTRPVPNDALAASHFRFQKLTLLFGAGAALIGGVLIAVGLGVFVLFLLAIWLIVRGASGVLKLKAGHPIERPTAWLI